MHIVCCLSLIRVIEYKNSATSLFYDSTKMQSKRDQMGQKSDPPCPLSSIMFRYARGFHVKYPCRRGEGCPPPRYTCLRPRGSVRGKVPRLCFPYERKISFLTAERNFALCTPTPPLPQLFYCILIPFSRALAFS